MTNKALNDETSLTANYKRRRFHNNCQHSFNSSPNVQVKCQLSSSRFFKPKKFSSREIEKPSSSECRSRTLSPAARSPAASSFISWMRRSPCRWRASMSTPGLSTSWPMSPSSRGGNSLSLMSLVKWMLKFLCNKAFLLAVTSKICPF